MPRFSVGLILVFTLSAAVAVSGQDKGKEKEDDPIKAKLDKAKAVYEIEIEKTEKAILDSFTKTEAVARKNGNKAVIDQVRAERTAFELTGAVPKSLPGPVQQHITAARAPLEIAYAVAIRDYTKANQNKKAAEVQQAIEEFKASGSFGGRFFYLVNKASGKSAEVKDGSAARGVFLVQTRGADKPSQQWSLVPVGPPGVFQIRNRHSGYFANIAGNPGAGGPISVWSGDAGDHNHWSLSREGNHYLIRSVTNKLYATVKDGSKTTSRRADPDRQVRQGRSAVGDRSGQDHQVADHLLFYSSRCSSSSVSRSVESEPCRQWPIASGRTFLTRTRTARGCPSVLRSRSTVSSVPGSNRRARTRPRPPAEMSRTIAGQSSTVSAPPWPTAVSIAHAVARVNACRTAVRRSSGGRSRQDSPDGVRAGDRRVVSILKNCRQVAGRSAGRGRRAGQIGVVHPLAELRGQPAGGRCPP